MERYQKGIIDAFMKITVLAKPGAREDKIEQVDDVTYRVSVKAPPIKGMANRAIVNLLAEHFDVSPSAVRIASGYTSRNKVIEIDTSCS